MNKLLALLLLTSAAALAGSAAAAPSEIEAYCAYTRDRAAAENALLTSPQAQVNVGRASTTTQSVAAVGVYKSWSREVKGKLALVLGDQDCELYEVAHAIQLHVKYALLTGQQAALIEKGRALLTARGELDTLIDTTRRIAKAKNATIAELYALSSARARLNDAATLTTSAKAAISVPALGDAPVVALVRQALALEARMHGTAIASAKQDNWDVGISAGVQHPLDGSGNTTAYGALQASYSFGTSERNAALDRSAAAYAQWKAAEDGDVYTQAYRLKEVVEQQLAAKVAQVAELTDRINGLRAESTSVGKLDTEAATRYRNQILVDVLFAKVDLEVAQAEVRWLSVYLQTNYRDD